MRTERGVTMGVVGPVRFAHVIESSAQLNRAEVVKPRRAGSIEDARVHRQLLVSGAAEPEGRLLQAGRTAVRH